MAIQPAPYFSIDDILAGAICKYCLEPLFESDKRTPANFGRPTICNACATPEKPNFPIKRGKLRWVNFCAHASDRKALGHSTIPNSPVVEAPKKWRLSCGLPDGLVRYLRTSGKLK